MAAGVGALAAPFLLGLLAAPRATGQQVSFETKTFDPQTIFSARFAPDGQTIVFSTAFQGNLPELFVSRPGALAPQSLKLPRTQLLSISSKGELAVLTDVNYLGQRLFRGTLARMPVDGAPRAWMENIREADWAPDGETLAAIHVVGRQDQLEYPVGKILHRADGYLSNVRVSPDGSRVAFFEHPVRYDNRGWVKVADRDGAIHTLAGEYWGLEGIAWTPDGSTVLYSGAEAGAEGYQARGVAAAGGSKPRLLMPSVGSVFVLDVARDGRWLVTRNDDVFSIRASGPGTSGEREFSWLGAALRPKLTDDGSLMAFEDESQSAGSNYAIAVRKLDGSPVIRLGEGSPVALSPDAKRVLANVFNPPQSVIYPIGPGEPIRLKAESLERFAARGWFPDGKRIVVCGNEPGRPLRCYEQSVPEGHLKPLTPEGMGAGDSPVSPDGRSIVTIAADRTKHIVSLETGTARPLSGLDADEDVFAWARDGRSLYVGRDGDIPERIDRLDLATGRRTLVRELAPPDRAGLISVFLPDIHDDPRVYAYTIGKRVSQLFVAKGVITN